LLHEGVVVRVVIGAFGAIARMGILELLRQEGFDVVAEQAPGAPARPILDRLTEARPDAVLLDLDDQECLRIAAWIASSFPSVTVVACSADAPAMRVFPPFHRGESYELPLDRDRLVQAVRG
jgi:DNA-binding NarL/FixJ family response regulator